MAITWHNINSYVSLGVDWCYTSEAASLSIAPKVYRWDQYNTDNYGGRYAESLSPDPTGAGSWSDLTFGSGSGTRQIDSFATRTYSRGHAAKTVTLTLSWTNIGTYYSGAFRSLGSGSKAFTLTVDALASYAVKYDANGGSGAPSAQTKWHGESLTLSSTKPTRSLYNFKGWSTAKGGSVAYKPGAAYTGNAALTLYAVWELAYKRPTITSVSAYRCNASGTAADDGAYARVAVKWSVDTSATSGNTIKQVKVGYRLKGSTGSYAYSTATASGASGTSYATIGGALSAESSYEVIASVQDASGQSGSTVYATTVVPKAFYPLDFLSGGHGAAFGAPATEELLEIAMQTKCTAKNAITCHSPTINLSAAAPSSDQYDAPLRIYDGAGDYVGVVQLCRTTGDVLSFQHYVRRIVSGTAVYSSVTPSIAADGTRSVMLAGVSFSEAQLKAIKALVS